MNIDINNDTSKNPSILLVEDDEVTSYMLEYLLQREGYNVTSVRDGKQALDVISNNPPFNLALLDVMIPYISGFELISHIHSLPNGDKTAVIMLSSKSQERDIIKALKAGASDYIIKPFQTGEILARIHKSAYN